DEGAVVLTPVTDPITENRGGCGHGPIVTVGVNCATKSRRRVWPTHPVHASRPAGPRADRPREWVRGLPLGTSHRRARGEQPDREGAWQEREAAAGHSSS